MCTKYSSKVKYTVYAITTDLLNSTSLIKGGLISKGIMTLVTLQKKGAKSCNCADNFNKLFTVKGGKFKLFDQLRDLAPFIGNGTKVKIPSEINLPL